MREYNESVSGSDKASQKNDVLYVYDKICTKKNKNRQIFDEYGVNQNTQRHGPRNGAGRIYGRAFVNQQKHRADEVRRAGQARAEYESRGRNENVHGRENVGYRQGYSGGRSFGYGQFGAAAMTAEKERRNPFKFIRDGIVNMFESIESRGIRDKEAAKEQALARKRFIENRHALFTALILLLVTVIFILFIYFAFFVISDINVSGSDFYSAESVIAASGIENGDNLYSFHAGKTENAITFYCPYIKKASISRTIPNHVSISLEDDSARFYADIYGDIVELSSGLRVLSQTDEQSAKDAGLTKLILPPVDYSVAGRVIRFCDESDSRYINAVLSEALKSTLGVGYGGRIHKIDLTNEYEITMTCDGMYIFRIGNERDCELKLRMAYKTITDSRFDTGIPAKIDVSEVGEASIRYDMRLVVD